MIVDEVFTIDLTPATPRLSCIECWALCDESLRHEVLCKMPENSTLHDGPTGNCSVRKEGEPVILILGVVGHLELIATGFLSCKLSRLVLSARVGSVEYGLQGKKRNSPVEHISNGSHESQEFLS